MHRSATTSVRASPAPADVLHQESDPSEEIALTTREKEVLQWVFAGKSSWEISVIFSCTEAGVNYHLTNIRRKFGVSSRWVAMFMALEQGLIQRP